MLEDIHEWFLSPDVHGCFQQRFQTLNTGTLPEIQNSGRYLHIVRQMAGAFIVNLEGYNSA